MSRPEDILKALTRWWEAIALQLAVNPPQPSQTECDRLLLHLSMGIVFVGIYQYQTQTDPMAKHPWATWPQKDIHGYLSQQLQALQADRWRFWPADWLMPTMSVDDAVLNNLLQNLRAIARIEAPEGASDPTAMPLAAVLGQAYEQMQSMLMVSAASQRKSGGRYYTPWAIARDMVRGAADPLFGSDGFHPDGRLRILDPACGGGIFLIAAYHYVLEQALQYHLENYLARSEASSTRLVCGPIELDVYGQWRLTFEERSRLLTECIMGVDIDAEAVTLTRMGLLLHLLTSGATPQLVQLPDLSQTIRCGNALIASDFQSLSSNWTNLPTVPFDWEKAFPSIMQSGGFDMVIGNPPYIDSEQMTQHLPHWRNYCVQHYQTAVGNWDLFCVFIEKALLLCQLKGVHSFIVPNKLASADYAASVRSLLTQTNRLLSIRDYSQVPVFSVAVYPLVYTVRRQPPDYQTLVRCDRMVNLTTAASTHWLDYQTHFTPPTRPWLLTQSHESGRLLLRLQHMFPILASFATVSGAATVAEAYALQPLITDRKCLCPGDLKLINSGTIDRYRLLWGMKRLRYLGTRYLHPVIAGDRLFEQFPKRYQQANQPKLIVAGMTRHLEVALDKSGEFLAGKSTSIVRVEYLYEHLYLLGLLNSSVIQFYFKHLFGGNRLQGGYFRVGPPQLRQLPIPQLNWNHTPDRQRGDRLIDLVQQRITAQISSMSLPAIAQLDQQIDQMVYDLYLLTDAEIAILAD